MKPLILLLLFIPLSVSAGEIFSDDFDKQANWEPGDVTGDAVTIPPGWSAARTSESWHPDSDPGSEPSMQITGSNPQYVFGGAGKAFVSHSESSSATKWTSDGILVVDIAPVDQVYVEFRIKFQPGWASDSEKGQLKLFRIDHYDGVGERWKFFSDGNSAPIYFFKWEQTSYGIRHAHSFRCDEQKDDYFCGGQIANPPRAINNGDMATNFVGDIAPAILSDVKNGGNLPTSGTVYHDQVYGDVWHKMGFFVKLNSSPGTKDGQLKFWLDDVPLINMNEIAWIASGGDMNARWNSIGLGGNDFYRFNLDAGAPISERERWYAIDNIQIFDELPFRPSPPSKITVQ